MKRLWMTCAGALAAVASSSIAAAVVHPPDVNPANFSYPITNPNPYFPLVPGTTFTYQGEKEGTSTTNVTTVTCNTRVIEGVTTTVVHDQAFEEGALAEDTFDYFAQDQDGVVWYFGEDTIEIATGSTEGSWLAGVNDADAGFIMLAHPQPGDRYYQEFARNVAEDQAKVDSLDASTCGVPYFPSGCSDHLLLTGETTRFDPGVVENKYYASGVGFVRSVVVKGGDEHTELVSTSFTRCR